jgi:hypothetical protein
MWVGGGALFLVSVALLALRFVHEGQSEPRWHQPR